MPAFPLEWRDPRTLAPHPLNFRVHPPAQRVAVADSLEKYGWLEPVVWNETTGRLLDGHARVNVAIAAQQATVPVRVVQLSEADEQAVLASSDWLEELAEIDLGRQAALLQAHLDAGGPDLPSYQDFVLPEALADFTASPGGAGSASSAPTVQQAVLMVPSDEWDAFQARMELLAPQYGDRPEAVVLGALRDAV